MYDRGIKIIKEVTMKRIDIRITDEVKQKLEELAKEEHRSMTEEIVYLIEKRYEELVP